MLRYFLSFYGLSLLFLSCSSTSIANNQLEQIKPQCLTPSRIKNKYPIVLAHGFMGFDSIAKTGYFHKIPDTLYKNGYLVCVTEVNPAQTVAWRAGQLAGQVDWILDNTNSKKVNIIAHSMGGLDSRYLISSLGYHNKIASLSTIGTPHRGSRIADLALGEIPGLLKKSLGQLMNLAGSNYNDATSPDSADSLKAIQNLTSAFATSFNTNNPNHSKVYYQSWGGSTGTTWEKLNGQKNDGCGILCAGYLILRSEDGPNDGLVSTKSAKWGVYKGDLDADHAEQIGHPEFGPLAINSNTFKAQQFYLMIARQLQNKGF